MNNICLSGGAIGADTIWGKLALENGHDLVHWSFKGHNASDENKIYFKELSQEHLLEADKNLKIANKTLKRNFPSGKTYIDNLLRRNYYQVMYSNSVYAVSSLDNNIISGGTAWACQMYIDRFIYFNDDKFYSKLFILDTNTLKWFQWIDINIWTEIKIPPKPEGIWAGIGSRKISDNTKFKMKEIF